MRETLMHSYLALLILKFFILMIPDICLWLPVAIYSTFSRRQRFSYTTKQIHWDCEESLKQQVNSPLAVSGRQPELQLIMKNHIGEEYMVLKEYWPWSKLVSHNYYGVQWWFHDRKLLATFAYSTFFVLTGLLVFAVFKESINNFFMVLFEVDLKALF
jgi:hypothetical protein